MKRKSDHIKLVLKGAGASVGVTTGLEHYSFDHFPLTDLDLDEVNLTSSFLNRTFSMPVLISCMTGGGGEKTRILNKNLAKLAHDFNLPFGLGSIRSLLSSKKVSKSDLETFSIARKVSSEIFILANIGAQQLVHQSLDHLGEVMNKIGAQALVVHFNPLQELIQPEGDRSFKGILEALDGLKGFDFPIIFKETGSGFGLRSIQLIAERYPFANVDISGLGGTHWGKVEAARSKKDSLNFEMGKRFETWGVPVATSLLFATKHIKKEIIASGGITNGQDIIKCLCLGASFTGIAGSFLRAVSEKKEHRYLHSLENEMKTTMLLLGKKQIRDLNKDCLIVI